jgi:hypothetical protein
MLPLLLAGCSTLSNDAFIKSYQAVRDSAALSAEAGFNAIEAQDMLELCIELNNQDDRNNPALTDPEHNFQARPKDWDLVYDSRAPGNTEWNRIWSYSEQDRQNGEPNPNDIKTNGLEPLNNAWLLAKSKSKPGHYAIAIRGTVSEWQSILADAYATTIPAYAGIEYPKGRSLPVIFAATPASEVHLGFAYASLALLFDDDRGILRQLKNVMEQNAISKLYITGHSQGAAVATLIHAFLYYAVPEQRIPYGLQSLQSAKLTSYLFAQPKPGNLQFAQDFARISANQAFVINNDRDPVPQVPLSLETISEVAAFVEADNADVTVGGTFDQLMTGVTNTKNAITGFFAEVPADKMADKFRDANIAQTIDDYFSGLDAEFVNAKARSLNYTLAGRLVPLFGIEKGEGLYPIASSGGKTKADILLQHHATSYRKLIEQQLLAH